MSTLDFPLKTDPVIAICFGEASIGRVTTAPTNDHIRRCCADHSGITLIARNPQTQKEEGFRIDDLYIAADAWHTPHVWGSVLMPRGVVRVMLISLEAEASPGYYRV